MKANLKINFLYNASYQILTLILPLVTAPYISRIMGAEKIGVYSYSYSIASYFALFILLGLNNYGNRTIAEVREDKKELSKTFLSIYTMQLLLGIIVFFIYICYVIFIAENKLMAWIQVIFIISAIFDINWFFFGLEEFKLTVTRNTIIKILNLLCIFIFVKKSDDIYIYGLIMVLGMLISQIILWPFIRNRITIEKIRFQDIKKHIIPNLILFIPVIAISLYTVMDKIMLGIMSNMSEVGYYENSNKLTVIPTMAVASLGTVMLPRMSNLIANGERSKAKIYIQKSLIVSAFLSSSMAFGLSAISTEFVPIFYGSGFEKCSSIITILVLSSLFISWANVIRTQYLIPNKKDKIYIWSVFLGALVNVIINLILIPKIQSIGAAIGTICAEMTVCVYQTYMVRDEINVRKYFMQSLPFFLIGIIMYLILNIFPFIISNFITMCIKIISGIMIYIVLSLFYYSKILKNLLNETNNI